MNFLKKILIRSEATSLTIKAFNLLSIILFVLLLFTIGFRQIHYSFNWNILFEYKNTFLSGFGLTILISIFSLILSLLIGTITALGTISIVIPIRMISKLYIEIIRGTPLLVQILVFYYVVANSLNFNNRFISGVLIMSLFSGAYIAEIVRAGIKSVAESQLETAKSLGLTTFQTYIYVIFPQVITQILPPLTGQFASLIKDSSLLSIISIHEFTMVAKEINSTTFSTMEAYLPLTIGYLILTLPISRFTKYLEKKFKYAS